MPVKKSVRGWNNLKSWGRSNTPLRVTRANFSDSLWEICQKIAALVFLDSLPLFSP